jgi:hypothetical protein
MKVLKAKKKKLVEGYEKPIWNDVGLTLLIGDWEGRTTYTVVDERTGDKFSCFEVRPRDEGSGAGESTVQAQGPSSADKVPF